jgi:octaprenyl-diphosphate synthase
MSEGELLQMEKSRSLNLSESVYFDIITNKTASLLAASCAAGAWSTTQDAQLAEQMWQFGEQAGIAFQIKDDLFDYGNASIGKPTGNDIKEKKITLPLIYTLNNVSASRKREMIYILKNKNQQKKYIAEIIEEVKQIGGMDYAISKMNEYRDRSLEILAPMPDNEYKKGLISLVHYTTERKY